MRGCGCILKRCGADAVGGQPLVRALHEEVDGGWMVVWTLQWRLIPEYVK